MSKTNEYQNKSRVRHILNGISQPLDTKKNLTNSALETGKDIVIGVLLGGVAAAALGKSAFVIGTAVTGVGHYMDNKMISTIGLGMMASNGLVKEGGLNGLEGAKERVAAFKDVMMQKTYLDKLLKPKMQNKTVNGVGAVQYFVHPSTSPTQSEFDMNGLDEVEDQVAQSAAMYSGKTGGDAVSGFEQDRIY